MRFRAPSETCLQSPAPHRRLAAGRSRRATRRAMLPLLGFRALRHMPGRWTRFVDGRPPCRRVPRPGFPDPPRGSHHRPSRRRSAGASMGFALQGVPLASGRYPSRGPCPPDVPASAHLPGEEREPRPPSGPRSRCESVLSPGKPKLPGRRCLPGLSPFRAFPPSARAPACSRGAGPLVLVQGDVPTSMDLRASRVGWIGLARLRAAGSRGVSHLATVVAHRSSSRGAGSWFRLAQDLA